MHWFLHYALNEVNTDILKSASTVVLCRDEREGQLAVCFRAANGGLKIADAGLLWDCFGLRRQSDPNLTPDWSAIPYTGPEWSAFTILPPS